MQTSRQPPSPENPLSSIPWWNDLTPAVRAELALPDIRSLSAQTVDVIVIGGGVAGLSAALSARRRGARVLLLEKEVMRFMAVPPTITGD